MNIKANRLHANTKCDRTAIVDAQVHGVDARDTIAVQAACSLHCDRMQPAIPPSQARA
jgi:hypothetical protein